jgi:predicted Zn-dependent peptidase
LNEASPYVPVKRVYPSGLTLVHERMPHRASIALGVWLRAGARDEPEAQAGMTHFLEHMLFKGTERRNAYEISASIEARGGHLDAFTAREHVCYSARALEEHLPHALDVLADVIGHSTLPEVELAREKEVVREEIASYEDSPEEKVHDILAATLWGADPLGRPILGSEESVNAFTAEGLSTFYRGRYRPRNLVVSVAGSFDPLWLEDAVGKAFGEEGGSLIELATGAGSAPPAMDYEGRDVTQLHLALARPGIANDHPSRYRLAVLSAIVGGGMSSRLFQRLREERGLAYSVYTSSESYRDTGAVTIAMGVQPARAAEALGRLQEELALFVAEGPTDEELDSGKAQIRGSMLLGEESVSNHMYHLALDELCYGRFVSLESHLADVAAVTREDVIESARAWMGPAGWSVAAVGPKKAEGAVREAARALVESAAG